MTPSIVALSIFLVTGPYSLSTGEARQVIAQSQAHFKEAGISLKVKKITKMRDRYASLSTISQSREKYERYRSFIRRTRGGLSTRTHLIVPPMLERGGIRFIGGYGEAGCHPRGVSISNGQPVRSAGTDGKPMSALAMSHEIGHTLNATHVDSISIMHPNALAFSEQDLKFSQSSGYRMRRCVR